MNKYKVCVYAICLNEEKFIDRWFESVSEADVIYVLDTGSTDLSVSKLREKGVVVKEEKIEPFRFDIARNMSLEMVDDDFDICVCIDLDEVLVRGWRNILEAVWDSGVTRLRYNYNWKLDDLGNPLVNFYIEKIHCRHGYKWINPVHEVLSYEGCEKFKVSDELTVNHYPDSSKSRSSYLPLLELAVSLDPENDRNMHYLGREYMYYGKYNESIDTLIKHLGLKSSTWVDERCASMRFISRCYSNLKRYDEAKMWLDKAMEIGGHLRDPFVERALLEYNLGNYELVIYYCNKALNIKIRSKSYINEVFSWDSTIYDLLSVSYFNIGDYYNSLFYIDKAIEMDCCNEMFKKNREIISEFIDV